MARITTHSNDPFVEYIYDAEKTIDYLGEDFLVDYGIEIPDNFLERYNKSWDEFWKLQKELAELIKEQENKK
jgi:hypothetical protein